ncbi:MAG TPA: hypothetical protein DCQ25_00290 [Elusimicrobia bacterium]|nr:hypothetical protein [Elusimicrobiota bacterium]
MPGLMVFLSEQPGQPNTFTVASSEPEYRALPSAAKASAFTGPSWPPASAMVEQSAVFQSFMVLSQEAEAKKSPSGLKARALMSP